MSIDVSVIVWTILAFLVLMVLLDKILYRPILEILDRRREKIALGLAAQREADHALTDRKEQLDRELEEIRRSEAEQLLEQQKSVDLALDRALDERELDQDARREQERRKTEAERESLKQALGDRLSEYAALIAEKIAGGPSEGRPS